MASEDELWALVADESQGVLATVARDGRPQLSNVLYLADPRNRVVRISTTAGRVKARNLARDPRAAGGGRSSDLPGRGWPETRPAEPAPA